MNRKSYPELDKKVKIFSLDEDFFPYLGILSLVLAIISFIIGSVTDILTGMSVLILLEIILIISALSIQKKATIGQIKKIICSKRLPIDISFSGLVFRDKTLTHKNEK